MAEVTADTIRALLRTMNMSGDPLRYDVAPLVRELPHHRIDVARIGQENPPAAIHRDAMPLEPHPHRVGAREAVDVFQFLGRAEVAKP